MFGSAFPPIEKTPKYREGTLDAITSLSLYAVVVGGGYGCVRDGVAVIGRRSTLENHYFRHKK